MVRLTFKRNEEISEDLDICYDCVYKFEDSKCSTTFIHLSGTYENGQLTKIDKVPVTTLEAMICTLQDPTATEAAVVNFNTWDGTTKVVVTPNVDTGGARVSHASYYLAEGFHGGHTEMELNKSEREQFAHAWTEWIKHIKQPPVCE